MMIFKETDVLDIEFRLKVIEEIGGPENKMRKAKQFKRYEIYNDKVAKYTEALLLSQFDRSTVEEMRISLTNVSICKKIINKIARVYSNGVEREAGGKKQTAVLEEFAKYLCFDTNMKKANRYLELHNNIWVMILPYPYKDANGNVLYYDLKMSVVPPFLFDVIEDADDRECAKCLIFSNFDPDDALPMQPDVLGRLGQRSLAVAQTRSEGDRRDQTIADTPMDYDEKNQRYTWWTNSFHFVTDGKGSIVGGPEDLLNPIEEIPGGSFNKDQDGNYYSISGDDLVDSCLLSNAMLTNINHIGIQQGYGQAYMVGKNLPSQVRLGPTKVIKLEPSSDGERAEFGYATSNPPLAELKELTITQIALLLSTNNLSTSNVKTDLQSAGQFASGISLMIDKAELIEDIDDQRQVFLDGEPKLWDVAFKWMDLYKSKGLLTDDLEVSAVNLDELSIKFGDPRPITSEAEMLANLKLRKDLGINTMAELIKIDNPEMTDKEIEEKIVELDGEKQKNIEMNQLMTGVDPNAAPKPGEKPLPGDKKPIPPKEKPPTLN